MRIYTRGGDRGETSLIGGRRVRKNAPRVEACGTVDELNAAIGWARSKGQPPDVDAVLAGVQRDLFDLGADLATPSGGGRIGPRHVARLEAAIDGFDARLPPLRNFILPGGARPAAALHLARTICRRAERRIVRLGDERAIAYVNRLSDLLFVLARCANHAAGLPDVPWKP
jgi:cob(I)alamin adenosyltransferase